MRVLQQQKKVVCHKLYSQHSINYSLNKNEILEVIRPTIDGFIVTQLENAVKVTNCIGNNDEQMSLTILRSERGSLANSVAKELERLKKKSTVVQAKLIEEETSQEGNVNPSPLF